MFPTCRLYSKFPSFDFEVSPALRTLTRQFALKELEPFLLGSNSEKFKTQIVEKIERLALSHSHNEQQYIQCMRLLVVKIGQKIVSMREKKLMAILQNFFNNFPDPGCARARSYTFQKK
jgi:hypothetical protein